MGNKETGHWAGTTPHIPSLKDPNQETTRQPSKAQNKAIQSTTQSRIDKSTTLSRRLLPSVITSILVRNLASRASIELVQNTLRDTVEQFLGVDAEEVPGDVEGLEDTAGFVGGLADEGAFEFVEELERELVF